MLTIGGFLAKLTGTERHKESPITTVRASSEVSDPAERERQYREALRRGLDELVAQMAESSEQRP